MKLVAVTLVAACACGGGSSGPVAVVKDAAVAPVPTPPVSGTPSEPIEPVGMHLDDAPIHVVPQAAQPNRPARLIEITLRSTPTGARAAVDGVVVGKTPSYWSGDANGKEHEFTFVYEQRSANSPRYGVARYRFVPVTSGVIHAKLEPLPTEDAAGTPPPEVVPPLIAPPVVTPSVTPPPAPAPVPRPLPPPPPPPVPPPDAAPPAPPDSETPAPPPPMPGIDPGSAAGSALELRP